MTSGHALRYAVVAPTRPPRRGCTRFACRRVVRTARARAEVPSPILVSELLSCYGVVRSPRSFGCCWRAWVRCGRWTSRPAPAARPIRSPAPSGRPASCGWWTAAPGRRSSGRARRPAG